MKIFVLLALFMLTLSCQKSEDDPKKESKLALPVFNANIAYGSLTDLNRNTYKTVTIGTQTWMAENLRTILYNDSTAIPNVKDNNKWELLTTGAYCNFGNTNNNDTIEILGRIYNAFAVNTGRLAPKGWHVATENDWLVLIEYLGGKSTAEIKLKEDGIIHWYGKYATGNNETGFTALPTGYRMFNGKYYLIPQVAFWLYGDHAGNSIQTMLSVDSGFTTSFCDNSFGYPVRCVKD